MSPNFLPLSFKPFGKLKSVPAKLSTSVIFSSLVLPFNKSSVKLFLNSSEENLVVIFDNSTSFSPSVSFVTKFKNASNLKSL